MSEHDQEQFVRLLGSHERRIYSYIVSMVPSWADADEIFQETNVRLWRDFSDFDPDTNFGAWATRVAYYQVLTWRKRASRNRLVFDDKILGKIAEHQERLAPHAEERHLAMGECMKELTTRSRDLLAHVYAQDEQIRTVAIRLNRSRDTVYKSLQRIRASLRECIERRMRTET